MLRSSNRVVAGLTGLAYLALGAVGFTVTPDVGFTAVPGGLLLGLFEVNPLHNVGHLVLGAALLLAAVANVRASKAVNSWVGALLLVLGMFGLFAVGTPANVLAINGADNVLHFGTSVLLLAVGLGAERAERAGRTT